MLSSAHTFSDPLTNRSLVDILMSCTNHNFLFFIFYFFTPQFLQVTH